jgi:hypothetical protein
MMLLAYLIHSNITHLASEQTSNEPVCNDGWFGVLNSVRLCAAKYFLGRYEHEMRRGIVE